MRAYLYQNKAWEMLEKKLDEMVADGNTEMAEQMRQLMRDTASEAFKKPTKSEDVADLLADAVNSSMFDEDEFARQVTHKTHRTLQQSIFKTFKACVGYWAKFEKEGMYDLRNEATCKASKKVEEALKDEYIPFV
jgi:hypothetical protein